MGVTGYYKLPAVESVIETGSEQPANIRTCFIKKCCDSEKKSGTVIAQYSIGFCE